MATTSEYAKLRAPYMKGDAFNALSTIIQALEMCPFPMNVAESQNVLYSTSSVHLIWLQARLRCIDRHAKQEKTDGYV